MTTYSEQLESAKDLGREYAANGIAAGEFRPLEYPLSDEYSDGITPRDIPAMLGVVVTEDFELTDLCDAWESGYFESTWPIDGAMHEIVGYQYLASEYTPEQLHSAYVERWIQGGACSPAARDMSMEDILNQRAAAEGIDRDDEYSFDSDDFPKPIFGGDRF